MVLIHPSELTRAWVYDMQQGRIVSMSVELVTEWPDGTVVDTTTASLPPNFEPLPRVRTNWLPGANVFAAVASHRELCASMPGHPVDPNGLDPVEIQQSSNVEVLEHQVRCGILKPRGEHFGFTFRGASRSVWRIARTRSAT